METVFHGANIILFSLVNYYKKKYPGPKCLWNNLHHTRKKANYLTAKQFLKSLAPKQTNDLNRIAKIA